LSNPTRVVLADDHPVVLAGVRALIELSSDIEIVGEATSGRAALQLVEEASPDVAIIDISLPDLSGLQLADELKVRCPDTRVLVLTVHENRAYVQRLLQAGVRGYLLKHTAAEDLAQAIRAVAAGGVYLDPLVVEGAFHSPAQRSHEASSPGAHIEELSPRERDVLRHIAQGYTNKEIAAQLDVSVKSIETYKARAAAKLKLHTRAEIVRYAATQGWIDMTERP
jgi:DNA-binding NarL/FixJ family response regulator